jgi:probable nitrogen fixation protein FixT
MCPRKTWRSPSSTWLPGMWGGLVTLANGWQLELPAMPEGTTLPITVEARRLASSVSED